jgi:hypothetical protein
MACYRTARFCVLAFGRKSVIRCMCSECCFGQFWCKYTLINLVNKLEVDVLIKVDTKIRLKKAITLLFKNTLSCQILEEPLPKSGS